MPKVSSWVLLQALTVHTVVPYTLLELLRFHFAACEVKPYEGGLVYKLFL